MHDPSLTLASLRTLRRERGSSSPFSNHTEFLQWADQILPLLEFDEKLAVEFKHLVEAATTVETWRPEKYVPNINNAVGCVARAIALLEHADKTPVPLPAASSEASPPAADAKVTMKWLFEHATWPVYATFLGSLAVSFGIGREVGKFETQIQSSSLSKPAPITTTPTNTMNSSSEPMKPEVKSHTASSPK